MPGQPTSWFHTSVPDSVGPIVWVVYNGSLSTLASHPWANVTATSTFVSPGSDLYVEYVVFYLGVFPTRLAARSGTNSFEYRHRMDGPFQVTLTFMPRVEGFPTPWTVTLQGNPQVKVFIPSPILVPAKTKLKMDVLGRLVNTANMPPPGVRHIDVVFYGFTAQPIAPTPQPPPQEQLYGTYGSGLAWQPTY